MKNKLLRITSVILTIVVLGFVISFSCLSCFADTPQGVVNLFDTSKFLINYRYQSTTNKIIYTELYKTSNVIPIGNNDEIWVKGRGLYAAWESNPVMAVVMLAEYVELQPNMVFGSGDVTYYSTYANLGENVEYFGNDTFCFDVSEFHGQYIFFTTSAGGNDLSVLDTFIANYDGQFVPPTIDVLDMYREQILILPSVFNNLGYYQSNSLTTIGVILCIFVGFGVVVSIINLIRKAFRGE